MHKRVWDGSPGAAQVHAQSGRVAIYLPSRVVPGASVIASASSPDVHVIGVVDHVRLTGDEPHGARVLLLFDPPDVPVARVDVLVSGAWD